MTGIDSAVQRLQEAIQSIVAKPVED